MQAIGIFDSGLGGLTVLTALRSQLPQENFIYFADTRFLPYGDRSESFIQNRSLQICEAFLRQDVKAIVVACNTATAAAAESIRAQVSLPVVALEPAVKPAVLLTQNGIVGVLATTLTLSSERFKRLVKTHAQSAQIIPQPCPGLAEAIETQGAQSSAVSHLLDQYLPPLKKADVLVLGCTHYPWVRAGIASRLPKARHIVDSGLAVARHVEYRLISESALGGSGQLRIATSGDPEETQKTIHRLLGKPMPVEHWPI